MKIILHDLDGLRVTTRYLQGKEERRAREDLTLEAKPGRCILRKASLITAGFEDDGRCHERREAAAPKR